MQGRGISSQSHSRDEDAFHTPKCVSGKKRYAKSAPVIRKRDISKELDSIPPLCLLPSVATVNKQVGFFVEGSMEGMKE